MKSKTFWLSFVDTDTGTHLGACVIDVTAEEAKQEAAVIRITHPRAQPGAEWLGAALRKAWQYGCNPGGQVGSCEGPSDFPAPRNKLLVGDELRKWGYKPGPTDDPWKRRKH